MLIKNLRGEEVWAIVEEWSLVLQDKTMLTLLQVDFSELRFHWIGKHIQWTVLQFTTNLQSQNSHKLEETITQRNSCPEHLIEDWIKETLSPILFHFTFMSQSHAKFLHTLIWSILSIKETLKISHLSTNPEPITINWMKWKLIMKRCTS